MTSSVAHVEAETKTFGKLFLKQKPQPKMEKLERCNTANFLLQ